MGVYILNNYIKSYKDEDLYDLSTCIYIEGFQAEQELDTNE